MLKINKQLPIWIALVFIAAVGAFTVSLNEKDTSSQTIRAEGYLTLWRSGLGILTVS